MSALRLFLYTVLLTVLCLTAIIYLKRPRPAPATTPKLVQIADGVFITSQLNPQDMDFLTSRGLKTIVDIRPDGEASDQAPSSAIETAAKERHLGFHYVPVPHESIPEKAVALVGGVLSHGEKPAVLYCRTGRRAVRTVALSQASQADGPDSDAILKMVKMAGFSADDLKADIAERIARRNQPASSPVSP